MPSQNTPSPYGYAQMIGDTAYNFGLNDFTIEFWVNQYQTDYIQTLFEISTNVSPQAEYYQQFRLLTVNEQGNLNIYGLQTTYVGYYDSTIPFTLPLSNSDSIRTFYNGNMLLQSEYNVSTSGNLTVNNPNNVPELIEPSPIQFSIFGPSLSGNTNYYVSVERYNGNLFLFVDGKQVGNAAANINIPGTSLTSNTFANINITNNPAMLTVGANRDGWNPTVGKFGDLRVTNGQARNVLASRPQGNIYSNFTSSNLGFAAADIVINGAGFNDQFNSPAPEELLPGQTFDTFNMQIYQASTANVARPALGWRVFKRSIDGGPRTKFTAVGNGSSNTFQTYWGTINSDSVSVMINGNVIAGNAFSITNGNLIFTNTPVTGASIVANLTGNAQYYSLGANGITTLAQPLYSNDKSITVSDASGFMIPNSMQNIRGVIFVNGERITYLYQNNNVLSGLMRGSQGTAVAPMYNAGTRVIAAGNDRLLPSPPDPGYKTWYTLGNNAPSDGEGLTNSNTAIALFLLNQSTVLP